MAKIAQACRHKTVLVHQRGDSERKIHRKLGKSWHTVFSVPLRNRRKQDMWSTKEEVADLKTIYSRSSVYEIKSLRNRKRSVSQMTLYEQAVGNSGEQNPNLNVLLQNVVKRGVICETSWFWAAVHPVVFGILPTFMKIWLHQILMHHALYLPVVSSSRTTMILNT